MHITAISSRANSSIFLFFIELNLLKWFSSCVKRT